MPKLPTYDAPLGALPQAGGRRATSDDFGGQVGQALGQVSGALRSVHSDIEEGEARKVLVRTSEIRAKYAKRLDEATVSGANLEKLKEEMNDELSRVGDEFGTRRGQDSLAMQTANTNQMFDQQANAISVRRAGTEAKLEAQKFLTSTGALINTNPLYLRVAEKDAEAFGATLRLAPEQRREIVDGLKNELNAAAAMAASRLDPQDAKSRLEAGDWNLTPEQRRQALGQAETMIRSQRADADHQRALKEYNERELNDVARDDHFKAIIGNTAVPGAIMNDARLQPATREHLITFMESRARELSSEKAVKSNPSVMRDLWLRANAPDGDPNKLYNADPIFAAVYRGELSTTDANQLNGMVANQKDENGRTFSTRLQGRIQTVAAAMRTSPVYQAQPELAAAIQLEMASQVEQKSAALRRGGFSPDALLDPDSKEYYFTANRIKLVADDVQKQMRAAMPNVTDLRKTPDAAATVQVGAPFVDPKGVQRVMTKELQDALKKQSEGSRDPARVATGKITGPGVPPPIVPPVPAAASKGKLRDEWEALSKEYIKAIDEFSAINKQKNPDADKLHAARVRMQEAKAKADAAHKVWTDK